MTETKCEVCENRLVVQWTDTHGIAACSYCAAPYRILHYDDNKGRVERPPEFALTDSGKQLALEYWKETGRKVFPGTFDMGILRGRTATYSGATHDDIDAFNAWYESKMA